MFILIVSVFYLTDPRIVSEAVFVFKRSEIVDPRLEADYGVVA
jgi:hypothetical protein